MKKRFKKFMALVMTAALLCSSMTVFAADVADGASDTVSGNGKLEGWVDKDVFKVELPTTPLNSKAYEFVLDPQRLIEETSGEAYGDLEISGHGLYFTNYGSGDAAIGMSGSSDTMTAVNKGTVKVKLSLSAKVTGLETVGLSASKDALTSADAAKTNIYLAIEASGEGVSGDARETAITSTGASVSFTLDEADPNAYKVTYTSGNASGSGYKYELTDELASANAAERSEFKKVSFNLAGECNQSKDVDWKAVKDVTPTVEVTWSIAKVGSSYLSKTTISQSSPSVGLSLPDGVRVASVTIYKTDNTNKVLTSGTNYTVTSTTLSIGSSLVGIAKKFVVKFSNGTEETITVK